MIIRRHIFIGHFNSLFPEFAIPVIVLHIITAQVEIRADIRRNDTDLTVSALDHHTAAGCVRHHKMAVLPVLRQQNTGFCFPDRFVDVCTVVQHMTQQHAGSGRESPGLLPFFDINTLNGDVKALFIDSVHTLIGQNIQHGRIKPLLVRTSPLQQRIILVTPDCVSHGNRFILAFRFAVKDDIQPGQGTVFFRNPVGIIIIPAADGFPFGIMRNEDGTALIDIACLPHGVHHFRTVIVFCVVHVIQVTLIVEPRQGLLISGLSCTDGRRTAEQSVRHQRCHHKVNHFIHQNSLLFTKAGRAAVITEPGSCFFEIDDLLRLCL